MRGMVRSRDEPYFEEIKARLREEINMGIVTKSLGGDGVEFDVQAIKSIGIRSEKEIDALILNGKLYGGKGGHEDTAYELSPYEFINKVKIRYGSRINYIEFQTNTGITIHGGGDGDNLFELKNIRVLGIGGGIGARFENIPSPPIISLHNLKIRYIENYQEPTLIERDQQAIIGIVPPGGSFEEIIATEISQERTLVKVMEKVFKFSFEIGIGPNDKDKGNNLSDHIGNALGNYIGKVLAKTEITKTEREEIKEDVRIKENKSEKKTYNPPPGQVGLEIVNIDFFKEKNGFVWPFPTGQSRIVTVPIDSGIEKSDVYDLTGALGIQISSMARRQEARHGYAFYPSSNSNSFQTQLATSPIQEKYTEVIQNNLWIGHPVNEESVCPDGVGRYQHYEGSASIYWHPETGAHLIYGLIRDKWAALGWETSPLGYPTTDEVDTGSGLGRYNGFPNGAIVWKRGANEAFAVYGAIGQKWGELNWDSGPLGFPLTDEADAPNGGRYNRFEGGSIYWTPETGASVQFA